MTTKMAQDLTEGDLISLKKLIPARDLKALGTTKAAVWRLSRVVGSRALTVEAFPVVDGELIDDPVMFEVKPAMNLFVEDTK